MLKGEVDSIIAFHRKKYENHTGPNYSWVTGDTIVCINAEGTKTNYLELYKHYIVLNPDGGSNDVKVITYDDEVENESYYRWDRFVSLEKFREMKLSTLLSS